MREEGGMAEIQRAIEKLSLKHDHHIEMYDPKKGKKNQDLMFE